MTLLKVRGSCGECDRVNNEIYIARDLKPSFKKKVLIHELAHAFVGSYLLEYKDNYTEEELCEFVAMYSESINGIVKDYFKKAA